MKNYFFSLPVYSTNPEHRFENFEILTLQNLVLDIKKLFR